MLSDIFSSFDEYNGNFVGWFFIWFFSFIFFFFFVGVYWVGGARFFGVLSVFFSYLWGQSVSSLGSGIRGFLFFVVLFFFFLIFCNFMGLIPYVFSSTSHLIITFSMAVLFWLSLLVSSIFWNPVCFFSHFLPSGAPILLNPFLVLVETVSVCVRPITLSVRLAANMGAGHIVIGLIGTYLVGSVFSSYFFSGSFLYFIEVFYFIFEFGICLVQGYIFVLLLVLYSDEHSVWPYSWFYNV